MKPEGTSILHLGGKDSQRDTAGESYDNRIRDELEDDSHLEDSHDNQDYAGHYRGDRQAGHSVLAYDAGDNHDEGSGRASDEKACAAEKGDEETGDDGRDETLLRGHAAGNTESDCKRQGDDAHYDTGDEIGDKGLPVITAFPENVSDSGTVDVLEIKHKKYTTLIRLRR